MINIVIAALALVALPTILLAGECATDDEFIRVARDNWTFETAKSHRRFVPFGSNFVLTSKEDLNMFGPRYESSRYDFMLAECKKLNINLVKVFLPIGDVLPDPQVSGEARIAPGYLENLDDFLKLARRHDIRVVVTLAEWGGHGCKWWHEGGSYFGRKPWKQDSGIDSFDILTRFWTKLCKRLKDNPTVFSYALCVEWTFPAMNFTWYADHRPTLHTEAGEWHWRKWVLAKYGSLEVASKAWGVCLAKEDDITLPDYGYNPESHSYNDSERKILDYQNFREWATLWYFKPQIEAIRAADPNHLVTVSNHMRQWDLWEGGAQYFMGFTAFEEKEALGVDYVTHHANFDSSCINEGMNLKKLVRWTETLARFCHAGKPTPVMIEEFCFVSRNPNQTSTYQAALVKGTVGSVSGWTTWYLQYPEDPNTADSPDKQSNSAWFTSDWKVTPWGERAKSLYEELLKLDLSRRKPMRIIDLDRNKELIAKTNSKLLENRDIYDDFPQPTDYSLKHEPDLDIRLADK